MSLLVVGLSHRSAPVQVLERAAVPGTDTGKVLAELLKCDNLAEALLLSTCNRVEVHAVVHTFHGGLADITAVLARQSGMSLEELSGHLYVHYAAAGVEHLFTVACGLDSMVVGEPQILGQLRTAYTTADQVGSLGRTLHELVQQALRVGKRVHTETGIDAESASVVSEAIAAAREALSTTGTTTEAQFRNTPPGLAGRRALVIGTGSMGALAAAQLRRSGVSELVLGNRTLEGAQRLAARCQAEGTPARAVALDAVAAELATVDLVVCCTGAFDAVLGVELLAVARGHSCAPIVVCDLGLPRDVEPGVGELPGVTLIDLAGLACRLAQRGTNSHAVQHAHRIVIEELRAYLMAQRTAEVIPTVTALRQRAAEVMDAELLRLDGRLPGLDAQVREEVAHTVRRVVDKLLHTPTVRVKQLAEAGGGKAYADALRELFGLDPHAVTALAATVRAPGVQAGGVQAGGARTGEVRRFTSDGGSR